MYINCNAKQFVELSSSNIIWLKALFKHIMFIAYVKAIEFSCIKFVQIADQNVFLHLFYVHKNSSIVYFYVHEWFFYVRLQ